MSQTLVIDAVLLVLITVSGWHDAITTAATLLIAVTLVACAYKLRERDVSL